MAEQTLFDRLKAGETIAVQVPETGKQFCIQPERWGGVVLAYTVLVDGRVQPGYRGKMLDDVTVRDWCDHLVEQPEQEPTSEQPPLLTVP